MSSPYAKAIEPAGAHECRPWEMPLRWALPRWTLPSVIFVTLAPIKGKTPN
jgi:hypothetical protein